MSGEHPYRHAYFFPSHDGLLQLPVFSQRHGGHCPQSFNPSVYLHGSAMGDSDVLGDYDGSSVKLPAWCGGGAILAPVTPNFSLSSSSTEAGGEDEIDPFKADQTKQELEEEEKQEKGSLEELSDGKFDKANNKPLIKKGEKRQREPRVAFITKSEVDHLEDGYRWRKYGQKAVKNSPYPRSYYRCTAQKCNVKKRVERSHQDPTTVITSYEGQHTHHQTPANVRSSSYYLVSPSPLRPSISPYSHLLQHYSSSNGGHDQGFANPSMHKPSLPPRPLNHQLPAALPDQGLLQDIFLPSFTS